FIFLSPSAPGLACWEFLLGIGYSLTSYPLYKCETCHTFTEPVEGAVKPWKRGTRTLDGCSKISLREASQCSVLVWGTA
uniref:Uncharacterized protein n=1 Tax=Callorhinchus milii TaxID=7868 RepID=A0A4W3GVS2_CALMI